MDEKDGKVDHKTSFVVPLLLAFWLEIELHLQKDTVHTVLVLTRTTHRVESRVHVLFTGLLKLQLIYILLLH